MGKSPAQGLSRLIGASAGELSGPDKPGRKPRPEEPVGVFVLKCSLWGVRGLDLLLWHGFAS